MDLKARIVKRLGYEVLESGSEDPPQVVPFAKPTKMVRVFAFKDEHIIKAEYTQGDMESMLTYTDAWAQAKHPGSSLIEVQDKEL